ncbi:hypothetical protein DESC_970075 [Desulfosarcina cetonica]|nr:hypothetical protein DESC_970075 [Desulfosarcina cetonica]
MSIFFSIRPLSFGIRAASLCGCECWKSGLAHICAQANVRQEGADWIKLLDMLPEAELAFLVSGASHVLGIANPSFPDSAGGGSVDRALALIGVRRVGGLPFAVSARPACIVFPVHLAFDDSHNQSPFLMAWFLRKAL